MSKEEKDIVVNNVATDSTEEKDNSTSFFGRFKKQVKSLNFKNNEFINSKKIDSNIDETTLEKELRKKEKEVKEVKKDREIDF